MSSYLTVAGPAEVETEAKRSRFLGQVARVSNEEEARAVVDRARKRHWDAGHHCSALVLGADRAVQRSHDDGEPSGTAGAPMLEVLRGRGVSDVVAVVTRYFGGVLLGAGGLARAYSHAVKEALDAAGVVERQLLQRYDVPVGHGEVGKLENELRSRDVTVLGVEYGELATVRLAVPVDDAGSLARLLAELTGGSAEPVPAGQEWVGTQPSA